MLPRAVPLLKAEISRMTEVRHTVYFGQKGLRVQITKVGAE